MADSKVDAPAKTEKETKLGWIQYTKFTGKVDEFGNPETEQVRISVEQYREEGRG